MWWRKKDAVMNNRILAIEDELVRLREEYEALERAYLQRVQSVPTQGMRAEFAALHAKLDGSPTAAPAKTTNVPLSANSLPSLFDELPDNDPRGLRPEERLLNARYREPE